MVFNLLLVITLHSIVTKHPRGFVVLFRANLRGQKCSTLLSRHVLLNSALCASGALLCDSEHYMLDTHCWEH